MKIGIIAAMPEELAYLVQHLDNAQEQVVLGNTYHTGTIASHEVVLVESGIGKVMSAMSVAILADHFQVMWMSQLLATLMDKWRNNRFISNQIKPLLLKFKRVYINWTRTGILV